MAHRLGLTDSHLQLHLLADGIEQESNAHHKIAEPSANSVDANKIILK